MKPKLVVLSGAGVSAESGIATFRDAGGLWEGYDVMEVASIDGWYKNRKLVLDFYNMRRKQAITAVPNEAHKTIAQLEAKFDVTVVTQNVDDLHEKAGSSKVIHLHGELFKSRSTLDINLIYPVKGWELNEGDMCERGSQLRPNIVWFGEAVPLMSEAAKIVSKADVFIVVGTSLQVYPAASLVDYVSDAAHQFVIDPQMPFIQNIKNRKLLETSATKGMKEVAQMLDKLF